MMKVGLIGYGKAGKAVASVLAQDPRYDLRWVAKRTGAGLHGVEGREEVPVIGLDGIRWFQTASEQLLMDLRVQLSSCVPSTEMETAGARIEAGDLRAVMGHPSAIGLAEFMNYPGVIHRDPGAMAKLRLFAGGHIDGHCPQLSGRDLNAYIAAGIRTEHEATTAAEAREKLQKGMRVLIREGSVSKDLHALQPLLTVATSPYMCLCTDDRNPLDIGEHGHLDYMIRTLIGLGTPPLAAYRAASLSAAEAFGLKDRGLIAPGLRADIVALDSLAGCHAQLVLAGGRVVDEAAFAARPTLTPIGRGSVRAPRVAAADFRCSGNRSETDVIGILEGKIITRHLREEITPENGDKRPDPVRDLMRIAVIERHGKNGNIATGFVQGFGITRGAIAGTVALDAPTLAALESITAETGLAQALTDAQLRAAAVPVSGAFYPATQPVSGTVSVANMVSPGLTDAELRAAALPVVGAFYPATQPVSAAALPLPTGAATETTLAALDAKLPALSAGRIPVELPAGGGGLTDSELRASPLPVVTKGYDAVDDMVKVKSVQKKFRDSFVGSSLNAAKWDSTLGTGGAITVASGTLTLGSGTTASAETYVLSKETFTIPFRVNIGLTLSQRIANQTFLVEAMSVDAVTGISIASEPAANGPVFPPVDGLEFVWARESAYPTDVPEFFGTCPDDADTQIDGVLGVYVQADWETMRDDEMRARNPVPQQVTMRQARLELLKRELLDDVEAVITAAGREAQIQWEYASVVERSNPVIAIVQQQQGMTDAQIDDLFREAEKL